MFGVFGADVKFDYLLKVTFLISQKVVIAAPQKIQNTFDAFEDKSVPSARKSDDGKRLR